VKIRTYSSFNMCSIFTTIVIWHETEAANNFTAYGDAFMGIKEENI